MRYGKKLIEVALPLDAINKASAREKSIRHGHPSTLHLWWARRPLAAARAVIFAQMVDDPSTYLDVLRSDPKLRRKAESVLRARRKVWEDARDLAEKAKGSGLSVPEPGPEPSLDDVLADEERQRLFRIIEDLVQWENTTHETVLQRARDEIWASWRRACAANADHPRAKELFTRDRLPAFHDPFAGGGSLPLEAQRLGLEAYASDLNPVAVLINKAMIEIPPKFAGRPPVNPESRGKYLGSPAQTADTPPGPPASSPADLATNPWRSRGYLPHFDQPRLQFVTFRLHDSLPAEVVTAWQSELERERPPPSDERRATELRKRIAAYLDSGHGASWLNDPRIADLVETALLHFDGQRYRLLAWCIMPNHAHVLVETVAEWPLAGLVHSWKSFTAHHANEILRRNGEFWFREYYDRAIRSPEHLNTTIEYIEGNPVKAGLAKTKESWRWSSAARRGMGGLEEGAGGTPAVPGGGPIQPDGREHGEGRRPTVAAGGGTGFWRGAQGLAEDVRDYGRWMRDEAEKRIGHLYPKVKITPEMAVERPDLRPLVGQKLTVIAWLWARTVRSPNPAFAHVEVPLASTFMLSTKEGKEAYVEPVIEGDGYRFTVKVGKPRDAEAAKNGTSAGKRAAFRCLLSGVPVTYDHIRSEGKAGRMSTKLMAIVAEGERGRVYLSPSAEHWLAAASAKPAWNPEMELPDNPRDFKTPNYGLTTYGDLFTPRQLVALTTFSDLVAEARTRVHADAVAAGMPDDGRGLEAGGSGATAYAEAVAAYLGFVISGLSDRMSTICTWDAGGPTWGTKTRNTFARQAIPMSWDFAEVNPLSTQSGSVGNSLDYTAKGVVCVGSLPGHAQQCDAASQTASVGKVISTDPPYYDNIGYADLSDFFYVWLRRSLRPVYPDLFATLDVPKAEELVATPHRHGSKEKAETFFLDGMTQAMHQLAIQAHPAFPTSIYYAFKQSETKDHGGTTSTGWETFLDAVLHAGFAITGTWPMRTELSNRMIGSGTNALASSIVLVCRPRPTDAPTVTRRDFVAALEAELPDALRHLQRGNIAPVDLSQAAIGPGMAVYTRYAQVLDAAGKPLTVREALALINQTLDKVLAEQEGDFDADTRWAVAWFEQYGFDEGDYGVAETLSKAKNTSVEGMVQAGILASRAGKVRLLRPAELPVDWDPAADRRRTAWEAVHHLVRVHDAAGESGAAELAAKLGGQAEVARELAYRLYTVCERKKRAPEALAYNALVQSWPEITRLAQSGGRAEAGQARLFGETDG